MSELSGPVPQRIGDAERDEAAELLREHLAAGRLDQDEFDERIGKALVARTADDLSPLFEDLPGPRPGTTDGAGFVAPPWQRSGSAALTPKPPTPPPAPNRPTSSALSTPSTTSTSAKVWSGIAAASWPLMIMICFITSWDYWWLMFIPVALSSVAGAMKGKATSHPSGHSGHSST